MLPNLPVGLDEGLQVDWRFVEVPLDPWAFKMLPHRLIGDLVSEIGQGPEMRS